MAPSPPTPFLATGQQAHTPHLLPGLAPRHLRLVALIAPPPPPAPRGRAEGCCPAGHKPAASQSQQAAAQALAQPLAAGWPWRGPRTPGSPLCRLPLPHLPGGPPPPAASGLGQSRAMCPSCPHCVAPMGAGRQAGRLGTQVRASQNRGTAFTTLPKRCGAQPCRLAPNCSLLLLPCGHTLKQGPRPPPPPGGPPVGALGQSRAMWPSSPHCTRGSRR